MQYLGNHFVWKPAFSADQLFTEFVDALRSGDVLSDPPSEVSNVRTFVTLHAAATMHGSTIKLETGKAVTLYAGYANRHGVIEVKANYSLPDMGKPVTAPVCLFLTDLEACNHCEADLLACGNPVLTDHWPFPIEIGKDGKLARVS